MGEEIEDICTIARLERDAKRNKKQVVNYSVISGVLFAVSATFMYLVHSGVVDTLSENMQRFLGFLGGLSTGGFVISGINAVSSQLDYRVKKHELEELKRG